MRDTVAAPIKAMEAELAEQRTLLERILDQIEVRDTLLTMGLPGGPKPKQKEEYESVKANVPTASIKTPSTTAPVAPSVLVDTSPDAVKVVRKTTQTALESAEASGAAAPSPTKMTGQTTIAMTADNVYSITPEKSARGRRASTLLQPTTRPTRTGAHRQSLNRSSCRKNQSWKMSQSIVRMDLTRESTGHTMQTEARQDNPRHDNRTVRGRRKERNRLTWNIGQSPKATSFSDSAGAASSTGADSPLQASSTIHEPSPKYVLLIGDSNVAQLERPILGMVGRNSNCTVASLGNLTMKAVVDYAFGYISQSIEPCKMLVILHAGLVDIISHRSLGQNSIEEMWYQMEAALNDLLCFVNLHRVRLIVCSIPVVCGYETECKFINSRLKLKFSMSSTVFRDFSRSRCDAKEALVAGTLASESKVRHVAVTLATDIANHLSIRMRHCMDIPRTNNQTAHSNHSRDNFAGGSSQCAALRPHKHSVSPYQFGPFHYRGRNRDWGPPQAPLTRSCVETIAPPINKPHQNCLTCFPPRTQRGGLAPMRQRTWGCRDLHRKRRI